MALLVLFSSLTAFGKEDPSSCTLTKVTNDCQFFKNRKDKPFIDLPDGTKFSNPLYEAPAAAAQPALAVNEARSSVDEAAETLKRMKKRLQFQAKLTTALQGSSSEEFRISLSQNIEIFSRLLAPQENKPSDPGQSVSGVGGLGGLDSGMMLPWPPNDSDAPVVLVTAEKIRQNFIEKLPEEKRKVLLELAADVRNAAPEKTAPVYNPAPLQTKPLPKAPILTPARKARINELFEQARATILEEIRKGRPIEKLSSDERVIYEKILTVRYGGIKDKSLPPVDCEPTDADAQYIPSRHEFSLCPGFIDHPDADIIGAIGHELGHAIDPCSGHFPVYKINRSKINREKDSLQEDFLQLKRMGFKWLDDETVSAMTAIIFHPIHVEAYDEFTKKGILEKITDGYGADPYKKVSECLVGEEHLRAIDLHDVKKLAREISRMRAEYRGGDFDREKDERELYEMLKKFPQCLSPAGGGSQLGEARSDIWGAKVLGSHLEKNPPKTDEEKVATIALFAGLACRDRAMNTPVPFGPLKEQKKMDAHPYHRERLEAIFLKEPRVQKALGCEPKPREGCMRFMGTAPSSLDSQGGDRVQKSGGHK